MAVFPTTTLPPTGVFPDLSSLLVQGNGQPFLYFAMFANNFAVASVSNTTPIELTLATANGYVPKGTLVDGQTVIIKGTGSPNANGVMAIELTADPNVIRLNGTTADGGAGAGGIVIDPTLGLFSKLIDGVAFLGNAANIGTSKYVGAWFVDGELKSPTTTIAAGSGAGVPFDFFAPDGARVVGISVRIAPGMRVALPGTMPQLQIFQFGPTGSLVNSWTQVDTSPDAAAYSVPHVIALSPADPITLDYAGYTWAAIFTSESGASSGSLTLNALSYLLDGGA